MSAIVNRDHFMKGLEQGMTFFEACRYSDNEPEVMTRIINGHPHFLTKCKEARRTAADVYVKLAKEEEEAGRFRSSLAARSSAKGLIGSIELWGDAGDIEKMNADQVLRVIKGKNLNLDEAACAVAATRKRLEQYLEEHDLFDLLENIARKRAW